MVKKSWPKQYCQKKTRRKNYSQKITVETKRSPKCSRSAGGTHCVPGQEHLVSSNGLSALENIPKRTLLSTDRIPAGLIHSLDYSRVSISKAHECFTHITFVYQVGTRWCSRSCYLLRGRRRADLFLSCTTETETDLVPLQKTPGFPPKISPSEYYKYDPSASTQVITGLSTSFKAVP